MLSYGSLDTFFGGLEGIIGSPNPNVQEAMEKEHTQRDDSDNKFTTSNYDLTTSSRMEWAFVYTPDQPPDGGFPIEQKVARALSAEGEMDPSLIELRKSGVQPRKPLALKELEAKLVDNNAKLKKLREPPVNLPEAMAARLYTVGDPMKKQPTHAEAQHEQSTPVPYLQHCPHSGPTLCQVQWRSAGN